MVELYKPINQHLKKIYYHMAVKEQRKIKSELHHIDERIYDLINGTKQEFFLDSHYHICFNGIPDEENIWFWDRQYRAKINEYYRIGAYISELKESLDDSI